MTKLEKRKEVATKAITLINEFIDESSILRENLMTNIRANDNFDAIVFADDRDEFNEYELTDISGIFRDEMEGWGPCGASFYEAVDHAINDLEYDYKNYKAKEEYIQYAGKLFYIKARCEEIYTELKKLDTEAETLIN